MSTPTVDHRISTDMRSALAREIEAAGGNEVFFFGSLDDEGVLTQVEVVARGDATSVPVFLDRAGDHQVLIHNHPSGNLTPSPADLAVASEAGIRGLGFFIINNDASRLYVVVEAFERAGEVPLDLEEISEIFSPTGQLSRALPGFEDRPGQRELAVEIARAFNNRNIVAFEGGTGIGKSYAYLVPAVLWAARNRSRVIVSTQTIALGEQLLGKDLPTLQRVLGIDFTYSLIKGRSNYVCRRKAKEVARQPELFADESERGRWISEILDHLESGGAGTVSALPRVPPPDVWSDFESTTDQSLKVRCPHYKECCYYEARREAFRSHIVVVNHHLFFADLALRRVSGNFASDLVIPGYNHVVFDEAHRLEDVASQHLGAEFSRLGVAQVLGKLASKPKGKSGKQRGRLPYLRATLHRAGAREAAEHIDFNLIPKVREVRERSVELFDILDERVSDEWRPKGPEDSAIRIGDAEGDLSLDVIDGPLAQMRVKLSDLARVVRESIGLVLDHPFEPEEQFRAAVGELRSAANSVEGVTLAIDRFLAADRGMLPWIELTKGRRRNFSCRVAPVCVAEILASDLYGSVHSAIMTSATLSVDGKWEFLGDRLGWQLTDAGRFYGKEFESSFRYDLNAGLVLPSDAPAPDSREYSSYLVDMIKDVAERSGGRIFVLFTSHRMLRSVAKSVGPDLERRGLPVLIQGVVPRMELLRRFQQAGNAVLFGTQTFWEGVDVPGRALACVIIARLPFRVPTHPMERGRAEELESRGKNPFKDLTVPQAALALKQGFGRLIRTDDDRGVVIIADSRIQTKPYGRALLNSLPPARRLIGEWPQLREEIEEYLGD